MNWKILLLRRHYTQPSKMEDWQTVQCFFLICNCVKSIVFMYNFPLRFKCVKFLAVDDRFLKRTILIVGLYETDKNVTFRVWKLLFRAFQENNLMVQCSTAKVLRACFFNSCTQLFFSSCDTDSRYLDFFPLNKKIIQWIIRSK